MELKMDCLTSRILLQKASSYKCQFCAKVCVSARLVFQVPDVSDTNQNVETICNSTFTELKDLYIKRVQKNYSKMNYVCR